MTHNHALEATSTTSKSALTRPQEVGAVALGAKLKLAKVERPVVKGGQNLAIYHQLSFQISRHPIGCVYLEVYLDFLGHGDTVRLTA
jgi:hypothetical protein